MPRPRKGKRVCCLPINNLYGPLNHKNDGGIQIVMSVEEYETIRLIDLQGFMQEEAAEQMNIARTTVQRIYNEARGKLADSLVNGKIIIIEGGNYELCSDAEIGRGCGRCQGRRFSNR